MELGRFTVEDDRRTDEGATVAQKTVVTIIDDIDGTELDGDARTVAFSVDGTDYEIDLGAKNAEKLNDALAEFIGHARRVGGRRGRKTTAPSASTAIDNKTVRAWAQANGVEVSGRGRLSQEVIDQYRAAAD